MPESWNGQRKEVATHEEDGVIEPTTGEFEYIQSLPVWTDQVLTGCTEHCYPCSQYHVGSFAFQ